MILFFCVEGNMIMDTLKTTHLSNTELYGHFYDETELVDDDLPKKKQNSFFFNSI